MDILKYCFGIDPVHEEREQIRRKKLEKRRKPIIQRFASVNAPPVRQPSENRYPPLNKQLSKWNPVYRDVPIPIPFGICGIGDIDIGIDIGIGDIDIGIDIGIDDIDIGIGDIDTGIDIGIGDIDIGIDIGIGDIGIGIGGIRISIDVVTSLPACYSCQDAD